MDLSKVFPFQAAGVFLTQPAPPSGLVLRVSQITDP